MRRFIPMFVVTLIALSSWNLTSVCGTNYAVLISSQTGWMSEFWNDAVLMFEILVDNGFDPDNIFVLYGPGTDYASSNPRYQPGSTENSHLPATITDYSATLANVELVLKGLANGDATNGIPKMTNNDFLFVWTFDHGDYIDANNNWNADPGEITVLCLNNNVDISASDFAVLMDNIAYCRRAIVMQQCFSGSFIPYLENNNTVILTAASAIETANRADDIPTTENEIVGGVAYAHGEFNFHVMGALHWLTPPRVAVTGQDTDGNESSSMQETFNWLQTHETESETPQYSDLGGIGNNVHLGAEHPGCGTEVFARDHTHASVSGFLRPPDAGGNPSNLHGEALWISPDILVDANLDGVADPNPEHGQANHIYANVYNINANATSSIKATFYYADPTVGLSWSDWTLIGSSTLPSLAAGGSAETPHSASSNVTWWPPSPILNSHYCLMAVIDTAADLAHSISGGITDEVAQDNNIVWRNVTVVDAYSGYSNTFEIFVANPFEREREITLTLNGVPEGWLVQGYIRELEANLTSNKEVRIRLGPDERQVLSFTVSLPDDLIGEERAVITIAAHSNGEPAGGYAFEIRTPRVCQVCENLFDKLVDMDPEGNIVPELAHAWEVSDAGDVVTFHLRESVMTHRGTPLTAEDVVYSLAEPLVLWLDHNRQPLIDYSFVDEIELIDDFTIRCRLGDPMAGQLLRLLSTSVGMIVSRENVEALGTGDFRFAPMGTGPFQFVEHEPGSHVTLVRFGSYWGVRPGGKEVQFLEIPDEQLRVEALLSGELNVIYGSDSAGFGRIASANEFVLCEDANGYGAFGPDLGIPCFINGTLHLEFARWSDVLRIGLSEL